MKRIAFVASVMCMLVGSAAVRAGQQSTLGVTILYNNSGTVVTGADGSLLGARVSADGNQEIACGGGSTVMWCEAHDSRDDQIGLLNSAYCMTTDAGMLAQIRSIAPNSHVRFTLDPLTGRCTSVYVDHSSTFLP